jgi:flagellin
MSLYIQSNIASDNAQTQLANSTNALAVNFQRLSSGYRINSAADDPAGLGISAQMSAQVASYGIAQQNTNDAISMAQTADGALSQMNSMLSRMQELATESANGDLTSTDRGFLSDEFSSLVSEVDRIANTTMFNGTVLLAGGQNAVTFQVGIGDTSNDVIAVTFGGVSSTYLGIDPNSTSPTGGTPVDIASQTDAANTITAISAAIDTISTQRANYGAAVNRFQVAVSNIQSMQTNLTSANAQIEDTDVAAETASMAQNQVLQQAGASVLAQANQAPQIALKLLNG